MEYERHMINITSYYMQKGAKEKAYKFILERGLLNDFISFLADNPECRKGDIDNECFKLLDKKAGPVDMIGY